MENSSDVMLMMKSATANLHVETEKLFFPAGHDFKSFTVDQYKTFMLSNFYFNQSLELALDKAFNAELKAEFDFENRKKAGLALTDLKTLEVAIDESVEIEMNFTSLANALGYMYVTEGSTLGGNVIKKSLLKNPNFADFEGFNYLGCYGEAIREYWINFGNFCRKYATTENEKQEMVNGAISGFEKMKLAFEAATKIAV